ncbi:MAG: flippase-like domain-containing protein, partial [Myxococcales bacterium]|nr:flippase-like domain-containing protein [Myxococcales bacterium]
FLFWTVIYWGVNGLGIALLAKGFGFDLGIWQAYGVLAILVVGIMIPAGPGFFGNYQFFLVQALGLFFAADLVAHSGIAFALTMNIAQFVIQVGFGIPFFLASSLGVKKLLQATQSGDGSPVETV